jgi:competence protein ComEC
MRGALAERLWRVYPRRWAPLAQALVLGQRETLGKETTNRIARSGLAHLLAISGLHVGMLAAALFGMGRMARLTTDGARLFTVVLTSGYVLLIGAPPSAVRAGLMVVLWTLTRVAGRASSAFDVLGLAALILLLARPWSVVEPGFQLSFAGAAAVGYASGEARALTTRGRLLGALNGIAVGMITSTAAVLLTAPITAAFFGRVAPAAIVGNVVAIPLLALALPALFASAALAPWPALAAWPAAAAVIVLRCIDHVAGILASAPWASFELSPPGLLPALCYLVLLVLGAHAVHGAWQRRRLILAIGIAGSIAVSWPALRSRMEPGGLAVFVLDVGQGEAIAVRTPNRRWLLIDAGPKIRDFDAGERRVLPFFRERGVRRLSAWIASHPDLDHVGGFPAIADKLDVDRVVAVDHVSGQVGLVELLRAIARDSIPWLHADSGDRLEVDGLELRFLHPAHDRRGGSAPANELSLVFLLQYGKFRMLFTGDVPGTVEDELSRFNPETVRAHVLKVSHHGSASSTSRSFLNAVRPELAVISVGRGNRYGHPSQHTIYRLSSTRVPVLRTDRAGTIVIDARMDGTWTSRLAAEGF